MKLAKVVLFMLGCSLFLAVVDFALGIRIEPGWKDGVRTMTDGAVGIVIWEWVRAR